MGIVLASGSPRRLEILKMIGLNDFRVIPDTSKEEMISGFSPEQTVCNIALAKAKNVSLLCDYNDIIIAADTLVYLGLRPLGKPVGPEDAAVMLGELSGRWHTVYTGVVLLKSGMHITAAEKTDVLFRKLSDSEISAYIETGEPMDKAGAYAAQGRGAVFIERIEGEFFNVIGLPVCRLVNMFREFGVTEMI